MNLLIFLLVPMLISSPMADAQAPPPSTNNTNPYGFSPNFNPSMAIVIVVLISAFFFLGFFSIYIRQCGGDTSGSVAAPRGGAGRSRRNRGLDPDLLATFPTLVYSEVKEHKIGKGSLECAVCITEFEDDETLRLLPHCSHVFHPDCIDAWLASHVTCPVCRSNLAEPAPAVEDPARAEEAPSPPEHVAIEVDRKADLAELGRIASRRKGARLPRSHSTGHSLVVEHKGDQDRFTLRLPEHVRREIVTRAGSMRGIPMGGEESSRRGYRGEGSSRIGRSIRLGRSGRWPSFFIRSMSMKMPGWAMGRRGEGEGSMKKGDAGEGSARRKMATVRAQFECLSGGKSGAGAGEEDESTSGALGRV